MPSSHGATTSTRRVDDADIRIAARVVRTRSPPPQRAPRATTPPRSQRLAAELERPRGQPERNHHGTASRRWRWTSEADRPRPPHPDRRLRGPLRRRAAAGGRPRARPLRQLVRALPALGRHRARRARHLQGRGSAPARDRRRWASTWCTSRRSIRSAASTARATTTRSTRSPSDVGSPWAIGADEGGHKAILPELGTPEDFRRLVADAGRHGLEIALDIAFQCAPDHPYVKEHPDWFRWRPGRHDPVRREPAQEVPGHLPPQLRVRRLARRCGPSSRACSTTGSRRA